MSLWKRLAGAASVLAADAHLTGEGSIGNLLKAMGQRYVFGRHNDDDMPEHQVAFTVGVIALGAKMGKADGIVTRDEVLAFKEVFKVPEGEMENVSRNDAPMSANDPKQTLLPTGNNESPKVPLEISCHCYANPNAKC